MRFLAADGRVKTKVSRPTGESPVHASIVGGNVDIFRWLLRDLHHPYNVCAVNPTLENERITLSLLGVASLLGRKEMVEFLLSYTDIDVILGETSPLALACQNNHIECVRLLVEKGHAPASSELLYAAIEKSEVEIAKILLSDPKVDVAAVVEQFSPFIIACEMGFDGLVAMMLQRPVEFDLNHARTSETQPFTGFEFACLRGQIAIVLALLKHEKFVVPWRHDSPGGLSFAMLKGHLTIIEELNLKFAWSRICCPVLAWKGP